MTFSDEALRDVVIDFSIFLSGATGYSPQVELVLSPEANAVHFELLIDGNIDSENYELWITPDQVRISAADLSGAFYATQTLRQLFPVDIESDVPVKRESWPLPAVEISDGPRYGYRGMHLDVSRHFFPVDSVKRYIDLIAMHKMNVFHWHLTDDQGWRIEIKKYPRLTEVGAWRDGTVIGHALGRDAKSDEIRHGGFYTQDDIREVVEYAARRYVTVIPEIDMPGHASALLAAYPEFACLEKTFAVQTSFGIFENVLCPTEHTFDFLADVMGEVAALFPGPYIHIGGDEVITAQWQNCASCTELMQTEGLEDYTQLQGYFVSRLQGIVGKLNKRIVAWDDVLDGGADSSATLTAWRGQDNVAAALAKGHDVIVTPTAAYFDFYQSESLTEPMAIHGLSTLRNVYEFTLEPNEITTATEGRILGGQGNLWSEYVSTEQHRDYMTVPRMSALSEILWSPPESRAWEHFVSRLPPFFERLDRLGVNASRSVYAVRVRASELPDRQGLVVNLEVDAIDAVIRYTLDGTEPNSESTPYTAAILLESSAIVRAASEQRESGQMYGDTRLEFDLHKAFGRSISFASNPDAGWGPSRANLLVDGVLRTDQVFRHDEWAGFANGQMNATVDLHEATEINEVRVGFDAAKHKRLHAPTVVEVLLSTNGNNWTTAAIMDEGGIDSAKQELVISFAPQQARFVNIRMAIEKMTYSAERETFVGAPLFVDEIVIN